MGAEATMAWGHGRGLTGRVRTLAVGPVGPLHHTDADIPPGVLKSEVFGEIKLSGAGLAGDRYTDDRVPGGPDTAVSVYPWEHYAQWSDQLGLRLAPAAFGENLTSIGLLETEVFVGDVFEWGRATVQVSRPRLPCRTIGNRHGIPDLVVQLEQSRRTGFYFRVLRSGLVSTADTLQLVDVDPYGLSVADVAAAMIDGPAAAGLTLERVRLAAHLLPGQWLAELENYAAAPSAASNPESEPERLTGSAD